MKVSVIIPTRNNERTIKALLKSIVGQTEKDIEIVVVDNSSSDKTKAIAKKYTKKVYNKGPERSAQRNFGAVKAVGKYLLFVDADMILTPGVIKNCVNLSQKHKLLVIPERTIGDGFIAKIRAFERRMYEGDTTIEEARFFSKRVFEEFGGYDTSLTGAENYELPMRISKKYNIGRAKEYIEHDESGQTLANLLKKKFYYANKSAGYAENPDMVKKQGTILFRKAYVRNWVEFVKHPILGISFVVVRVLETIWAVAGYVRAVGWSKFLITFSRMFK